VDVWDESFLPAGTVHLRYPRIVQIARRLKVDYAPAMVGFEVRGGRSAPKFDGIVICKVRFQSSYYTLIRLFIFSVTFHHDQNLQRVVITQ
jgi:hypothetical protein